MTFGLYVSVYTPLKTVDDFQYGGRGDALRLASRGRPGGLDRAAGRRTVGLFLIAFLCSSPTSSPLPGFIARTTSAPASGCSRSAANQRIAMTGRQAVWYVLGIVPAGSCRQWSVRSGPIYFAVVVVLGLVSGGPGVCCFGLRPATAGVRWLPPCVCCSALSRDPTCRSRRTHCQIDASPRPRLVPLFVMLRGPLPRLQSPLIARPRPSPPHLARARVIPTFVARLALPVS